MREELQVASSPATDAFFSDFPFPSAPAVPSPFQSTLAQEATFSGVGLFTGEKVAIKICPAAAEQGIVFQRVDLEGAPEIPARLSFVRDAPRSTRLAVEKGSIVLVEHLLSALYALGIDNARIEVTGPEIPAADGSAKLFVELIERAGIERQTSLRTFARIETPIFWSDGEIHLIALPSKELRLSYTMHYPHSPLLRSQYYSFCVDPESYKLDIAPARTFSLYEELLPFIEKGLMKGGGLENALIIQGERVLNPDGVRFPDEMVRHKILDLLGDLALLGVPLLAHVIAIRSGHASNVAFAKAIAKSLDGILKHV